MITIKIEMLKAQNRNETGFLCGFMKACIQATPGNKKTHKLITMAKARESFKKK